MKNTLENSKLITDFIGADLLKDLLSDNNGFININIDIYEQCKFHSDWNWLISVVEKIESLGHCVLIFKDSVYIKENTIISSKTISKCENRPKIEAVYNACLEFIKWYNKQDKNNENYWFNEYQEVENYIIKKIGDKFLEATPDKYKTASEATIALLEDNWE